MDGGWTDVLYISLSASVAYIWRPVRNLGSLAEMIELSGMDSGDEGEEEGRVEGWEDGDESGEEGGGEEGGTDGGEREEVPQTGGGGNNGVEGGFDLAKMAALAGDSDDDDSGDGDVFA